jgi:DNA polymerase (family 10)
MPTRSSRMAIAKSLREMAGLLALAGESPFRARAYERAATAIERLDVDLAALVEAGRLTELPGIGRGIAATIAELQRTGRSRALDALRGGMPPGALSLGRIPGLSLDKIRALHAALGVETVAELQAACEDGRVRGVKGLGEKTERRLLERILALEAPPANVRLHLDRALALAEAFAAHVRSGPGVLRAEIAGALRRRVETVDRLVFVAAARAPEPVIGHALASPLVASVSRREAERCAAVLGESVPLELAVVKPDRYPGALLDATGSPGHLRDLGRVAHDRGLVLDTTGLTSKSSGTRVPAAGEDDLYRRLGLPSVPPELREGSGEVEAAEAGTLPEDLVTVDDLQGLVHCHTVYSDGKHSIADMARAADAMGMRYLTITDHSPTAFYARGLDVDRLRAQWDEIARVQETVSVRLLRGTESDILADGRLDYPDAILEQMDVVIASIHARHRMDADRMTRRLVRAMQHPCFKIWGHGLGRLLLSRPPIECRVEEVLDAAAGARAAIEINGDTRRLDLEPRWIRAARERGLRFVVSTDAHSVDALTNQRYGVAMGRRGWVRRGEVLNTFDTDAFVRAVAPRGPA